MKHKNPEEVDDSDKGEIKIVFYNKDVADIIGYSNRIKKMIERGDKVPARVLKKLLSFFEKPLIDESTAHKLLLEDKDKQVRAKLFPKYNFNIKLNRGVLKTMDIADIVRFHEVSGTKVEISLSDFLTRFFATIESQKHLEAITSDKDKFVKTAYTFLYQYLKPVPAKRQPKFYNQTVIIGHLAACFGLILDKEIYINGPSKGHYYTEYLHAQTTYICKKVKQLKDKK